MMQLSLTNDREPGEESYIEDGWIRAAQHNIAAFELLYLRYRERIYGYLRTRLKSDEDATDLTQQIFLQAMHALPNGVLGCAAGGVR